LFADNVVGDNVIVIEGSHDIDAYAQVPMTIVEASVQTTTIPMYIPVVYGDHDMENSFLV